MSANKFENHVQHKMEDLRLQPSAQVWEEVERRIREKKRRRIIIFWFLFGGLLLSGGAWWMLNQRNQNKIAVIAEKKDAQENIKPAQTIKKTDSIDDDNNTNEDKLVKRSQPEKNNISIASNKNLTVRKILEKHNSAVFRELKMIKENSLPKTDRNEAIDIKSDIADMQTSAKDEKVKTEKQDEPNTNKPIAAQRPDIVKETKEEKKDTINTQIASNGIEPATQKKNQKKNKWETSLSFTIGSTKLTNGIGSGGPKSLAYSNPNTSTGGGYQYTSYADSIPLKGTNLQLGLSAKRKLGTKTAFSIGLNFSAYSTQQIIGSFKDSLVTVNNNLRSLTTSGFYQTGNQDTYHNKYYYLQVPLNFHWQLNKGDKLPLEWANGLAPAFLIGSNAVVYDKSTRIFYKDKRVFNSFNLVYETALMGRLFKDKRHPLTVGIYYNYHLNRLQKISPPNYNYLSSYGIKLNWVLKK